MQIAVDELNIHIKMCGSSWSGSKQQSITGFEMTRYPHFCNKQRTNTTDNNALAWQLINRQSQWRCAATEHRSIRTL